MRLVESLVFDLEVISAMDVRYQRILESTVQRLYRSPSSSWVYQRSKGQDRPSDSRVLEGLIC